jgi:hypothetical protein
MPQVPAPLDLDDQAVAAQIADVKRSDQDDNKIDAALKFEVSVQRCPKST